MSQSSTLGKKIFLKVCKKIKNKTKLLVNILFSFRTEKQIYGAVFKSGMK